MHNMANGIYANQILKLQEDVKIAISQESRSYTEMIANIDKVLGYDYTLDGDGNIIRSSITDSAGDNAKLDQEILLVKEQVEKVQNENRILTNKT